MSEEWRDVVGYEGRYQVSSMGRVKSLERKDCLGRTVKERILKPGVVGSGYLMISLCTGGKQKNVLRPSFSLPSISREPRQQIRCQSYQ